MLSLHQSGNHLLPFTLTLHILSNLHPLACMDTFLSLNNPLSCVLTLVSVILPVVFLVFLLILAPYF